MITRRLAFIVALLVAKAAVAQVPIGSQFKVNSYTTSSQNYPAIGVDGDGDFVVVWHSNGSDGDSAGNSVQGQRYDSDGTALGAQFQVNTYTTSEQTQAAVALAPDGDYVVVWQSFGSPPGGDMESFSIHGQRYAFDGTALGAQFQINTYTSYFQSRPRVAADAVGDFVVAWDSYGSASTDTTNLSIQGQRYASDGTALGSEFQVNTYTTGSQNTPSIAMDAAGDFVVVWQSGPAGGSDTSVRTVRGQRYFSDGSTRGAAFQVNTYTTDDQYGSRVAADVDGDFVVVWVSKGSSYGDDSDASIQGQRYGSNGSAVGSQFQVNSYTTDKQSLPTVALDMDADFVVVWQSEGSGRRRHFGRKRPGATLPFRRQRPQLPVPGQHLHHEYPEPSGGRFGRRR